MVFWSGNTRWEFLISSLLASSETAGIYGWNASLGRGARWINRQLLAPAIAVSPKTAMIDEFTFKEVNS